MQKANLKKVQKYNKAKAKPVVVEDRDATQQFLAIRKEWYAKLKQEGFNDLEYWDNTSVEPKPYIKGQAPLPQNMEEWTQKQEYYEQCATYLNRMCAVLDSTEREVWQLHSEGFATSYIIRQLGLGSHKTYKIIKNLSDDMQRQLKEERYVKHDKQDE
jgi:hypothetical protein